VLKASGERGGEINMGWLGGCVAMAEGSHSPLPFCQAECTRARAEWMGEKPQISCPLAGNVQAFRGGKESREGENRRKISKHLLNICVGTGAVLVPSFLDFTEY